jgi:hypothetical protein
MGSVGMVAMSAEALWGINIPRVIMALLCFVGHLRGLQWVSHKAASGPRSGAAKDNRRRHKRGHKGSQDHVPLMQHTCRPHEDQLTTGIGGALLAKVGR